MFIRVAVPVPQLDLLTYRVSDDMPRPLVGARVVVPLGSRTVTGIVVDTQPSFAVAGAGVKSVRQVLDHDAFVPADVVALATWTAEYYAAGPGEALTAVLPPKARGARADAHKTVRVAAITTAGLEMLAVSARPSTLRRTQGRLEPGRETTGSGRADTPGEPFDSALILRQAEDEPPAQGRLVEPRALTPRQHEALSLLAGTPVGIPTPALAARGFGADMMRRLARRQLVSLRHERVERAPFPGAAVGSAPNDPDRPLTEEQASAFGRLRELAQTGVFRVALLQGVTGSGKTEIYLRLAAAVRDAGRRVLILVPEIALTPAVWSACRQAFGERVAVQHSGLSDGERHDQWQRIRRGEVDVVVGTRSAVFAPLAEAGLIIVDEEHDASYKQEESPRYNGRDVAIVRGQRAGALVVLGSATPSMESAHNAFAGKYERIVLERRVLDRPLASVSIVNMRDEYAAVGPDVVLSRALTAALDARLERREQSLVLLNRRGFATSVFCRQCGAILDCPNCSVSLVIHGQGPARRGRCHYCNYSVRVPRACLTCAGPYLEQSGFGTERIEAEIKRSCPRARVARLDRDAVRRKGALGELLSRFYLGHIDILVGTQMIAKGHDFPRVTLVGVISADVGLGLADFRASERTFQLLTQVAGRAGRGEQPGDAIIQTLFPDHYAIELACRQDYQSFYERELRFRRAMRYPPLVSLINVMVRSRTFARAMRDAEDIAQGLRQVDRDAFRVLGPAPAPLGKLRGEYRVQILMKGTNRKRMREALQSAIAGRPDLARRTVVDVDPLSVL